MKQLIVSSFLSLTLFTAFSQTGVRVTGGTVYQVTIRNSSYNFNHAMYSVFIPGGVKKIKGIFVHQHGCTMEGRGVATAYDLQYQAFAKKWDLAVVGPDLFPKPGSSCHEWIHPVEDGSAAALLAGLESVVRLSGHEELSTAPWLLWGHSGGGYWVLAMLDTYPDRIIAAVCYSAAFDPAFTYSKEALKVPVLLRHAGPGDFNNPGVDCWGTALHSFAKIRKMGGLVSIAYNPKQNHNLSYIRYMTIPFFESVLSQRLSPGSAEGLKGMDMSKAWLCDTTTAGKVNIFRASTFMGDKLAMSWLPDSMCAAKLKEYITTCTVVDNTPPVAPDDLELVKEEEILKLIWRADADIESGIKCFNIYRNGKMVMRYPPFGDFQSFSTNGDDAVPVVPPSMSVTFLYDVINENDSISVATVNSFGLESPKAKAGCGSNQNDK